MREGVSYRVLGYNLDFWFVFLLVASLPFDVAPFNIILSFFILYVLIRIITARGVPYSFDAQFFKSTLQLPLLFFLLAFSTFLFFR